MGESAGEIGRGGGILIFLLLKTAPGYWEDEMLDFEILIALVIAGGFFIQRLRSTKSYESACFGSLGCLANQVLLYLVLTAMGFLLLYRTRFLEIATILGAATFFTVCYRLIRRDDRLHQLNPSQEEEEGRGQGPAPSSSE